MRGETNSPSETNEIPVKEKTLLSLKKGEEKRSWREQVKHF
jgi:hypothetical protein